MRDSPEKRLADLLRERRRLSERLRRGEITRDEYLATFRRMVKEARLNEPNLERPWWADDLGWLARSFAQAVWSGVLREREHVMFLRPTDTRPGIRRISRIASLDECRHLAVHLESAVPALAPYGFDLPPGEVERALAAAAEQQPGLVVRASAQVPFQGPHDRRRAIVLDWAALQALGRPPRRGDPRGL